MGECWAACLGNCGDKMSREHLISESIFPQGKVTVRGFPWCKDEAKEIGMAGLTAKILCEPHNHDLSPIDEAGAKAFKIFTEISRLAKVREKMRPGPRNVVRYRIDGP